ncbi:hypothetical protein C2S52_009408 [Perilla frutescens var. hirtella]|nr:hypothetical protein C2S52_009408 [Perilla frutescens var. hirtella]
MGRVAPVGIITDQDDSIKLALQKVMPQTIHRYCIWHIMAKLQVKFRGVADYNKVINEWKGVVYDSLDIATFEMNWAALIAEHGFEGNRWLRDLYSEREKWVPMYLNHTFWAEMISTQRSEGMHAYFDEYLHSRCMLTQFMEQYEMAIGKKIQKEFHADFESKNKIRRCLTEYKWEAQFQEVYTNSIFKRVQDNIERMKYCFVQYDQESQQEGLYIQYVVEYRRNGEYLECNCRNFEFKGLLCCHIFEVIRTLRMKSVNERYILRRWRKDALRKCSSIFFSGGYPHMTDEYKRYQELEKLFLVTADLVIGDGEKTEFAKSTIDAMNKSIENWGKVLANNADEQWSSQVSRKRSSQANENAPILNPQVTRTKGRPTERRFRSCSERGGRRGRGRTTTVAGRGRGSQVAPSLD